MSHRDESGQHAGAAVLRALGYFVECLPTKEFETCDLLARREQESLWVEVKTLLPTEGESADLRRQGHATVRRAVQRSGQVNSKLRKAAKQLAASKPPEEAGLRLAWCRFEGAGVLTRSLELYCTLFGIRWLRATSGPLKTAANIIPCLFADRSWFQSHPEVCAVVAQPENLIGIYVNPFASEVDSLRKTRLFDLLARFGAVFDLKAIPEPQDLYILDRTPDNAKSFDAVKSLRERYGIAARSHTEYAASVAWPGNERGEHPGITGWEYQVDLWKVRLYLMHEGHLASTSVAPS